MSEPKEEFEKTVPGAEERPAESNWYDSSAARPEGEREAVYSDAHYEPAADTTTPTRY